MRGPGLIGPLAGWELRRLARRGRVELRPTLLRVLVGLAAVDDRQLAGLPGRVRLAHGQVHQNVRTVR